MPFFQKINLYQLGMLKKEWKTLEKLSWIEVVARPAKIVNCTISIFKQENGMETPSQRSAQRNNDLKTFLQVFKYEFISFLINICLNGYIAQS